MQPGDSEYYISDELSRLIERQHALCHLCRQPVRRDVPYGHPMFPSRDHIVPRAHMAKGEAGQIALAHLFCNNHRGDKHLRMCYHIEFRRLLAKATEAFEEAEVVAELLDENGQYSSG